MVNYKRLLKMINLFPKQPLEMTRKQRERTKCRVQAHFKTKKLLKSCGQQKFFLLLKRLN